MLSLLNKYNVMYTLQNSFPYVGHPKLQDYFNHFSACNVLNSISRYRNYGSTELTQHEAKSLLNILAPVVNLSHSNLVMMRDIKMFTSSNNTQEKLYSVNDVIRQSLFQECVMEPSHLPQLMNALPSNIILFSAADHIQNQVLAKLNIQSRTDVEFLENYLFPKICSCSINDLCIDSIMTCVLNEYYSLYHKSSSFKESLKNLKFVKDASDTRKSPAELFNPDISLIAQMFHGENVFPGAPFSNYIAVLKECGLRDSLSPQEILNLIFSISENASNAPQGVSQEKLSRAKAIVAYIQMEDIKRRKKESCQLNRSIMTYSYFPFDTALLLLSERRSWLPVLAEPPSSYPRCLPWKGSTYTSHFVSLGDKTCVSCYSKEDFMLVYGSQALFTEPLVDSDIYQWLGSPEPTSCLCPHFYQVISNKDQIQPNLMLDIVSKIYGAMQGILLSGKRLHIDSIRDTKEWVYIKKDNKFVDVKSIARSENPNFRHSIEPYLHILPDSISSFANVFLHFGMNETITEAQIISILDTIKYQIANNSCTSTDADVWDTTMAILNWVTNNATQEVIYKSMLVPAETSSGLPNLKVADTLVYTDNDFL